MDVRSRLSKVQRLVEELVLSLRSVKTSLTSLKQFPLTRNAAQSMTPADSAWCTGAAFGCSASATAVYVARKLRLVAWEEGMPGSTALAAGGRCSLITAFNTCRRQEQPLVGHKSRGVCPDHAQALMVHDAITLHTPAATTLPTTHHRDTASCLMRTVAVTIAVTAHLVLVFT